MFQCAESSLAYLKYLEKLFFCVDILVRYSVRPVDESVGTAFWMGPI